VDVDSGGAGHHRFEALATVALKSTAYLLTGSVGLLSDAAESLVNLVAAVVALGALALEWASKPADQAPQTAKGELLRALLAPPTGAVHLGRIVLQRSDVLCTERNNHDGGVGGISWLGTFGPTDWTRPGLCWR
jgi:hypothetical protein